MMANTTFNVIAALACAVNLCMPSTSDAGGLFSAAIRVNESVITNFELEQRQRFLEVLKFPGNPAELAREQLIDERLKRGEAKRLGIRVQQEALKAAVEEYAGRANLPPEEFIAELAKAGVDQSTLIDFLSSAILWGDVVRTKFGAQSAISEEQVERTVKADASGTSLEVSLTEIIMAVDPETEQDFKAKAEELAKIQSITEFSDAAREFSDAPTAEVGGKITWQKLDTLPPVLQPLIFGLASGDVTPPLQIPNAIALFQLRDIRETAYRRPAPGAIDYAIYQFSSDDAKTLNGLRSDLVHCDDLFSWAKGNPTHSLIRESIAPSEIPAPRSALLAPLDDNEFVIETSTNAITLTMLCGRAPNLDTKDIDLEQIRNGLRGKRLEDFANGFLENLRDDARIIYK
jgi:peptidyl-prolyl cis-trans isomerase SurA